MELGRKGHTPLSRCIESPHGKGVARKLGSRLVMKYFAIRDGTACWFVA